MKISFNWLCDYIDGLEKIDPYDLAEQLTLKSFEVDNVLSQKIAFEKMVVGKIINLKKHPAADKLLLVETDIGKDTIQIVCGCTNLKRGQLVLVALPGAKVKWHGEGDFITLKETRIRGEKSYGMICTAEEVGLSDLFKQEHNREACILDIFNTKPGTPISRTLELDDVVFDVDNKTLTNRPDLWGHVGVALEISAISGKKFRYKPKKYGGKKGNKIFSVEIKDKNACRLYSGVLISGLKVKPSPYWMQKRLFSVGVRPINNIVDITNYVMLEIGQPMHAFDTEKLSGNKIIVDTLKKDEKLRALDQKEYTLSRGMIVIKDKRDIQAVGGIIGGISSEISKSTTTCFFESANFDPVFIRRGSIQMGLRTEASTRHEKGLDPHYTLQALYRAIELTSKLCPQAKVDSEIISVGDIKHKPYTIYLKHDYLEKKIGVFLEKTFVKKVLSALGFSIKESNGIYRVMVPSFRATKDIQDSDDLVEEVARMYGYNRIEPVFPSVSIRPPEQLPHLEFEKKLKYICAKELGFCEVYNYVFEYEHILKKLGYDLDAAVEIQNAVQKDIRFLRFDLVSGLLRTIEKNQRHFGSGKIFEIGRVFNKLHTSKEGLPTEKRKIALVRFFQKGDQFLELKGDLEFLFEQLHIRSIKYSGPLTKAHRYCSLEHTVLSLDRKEIGYIGKLSKKVARIFGIKKDVVIASLDFDTLLKAYKPIKKFQPIPKYPAIELDLSMIVDEDVLWYDIVNEIENLKEPLIRNIELFDVYRGAKIGAKKKSIAFRITYRSDERTLKLNEAENVQKEVIKRLKEKFSVKVRQR